MGLSVIRNDIAKVDADIIVNTANAKPIYGNGVDRAIYEAAGPIKLLEERRKIGVIEPGEIAVTHAFDLQAKYIIHTVGPWWEGGGNGEFDILHQCYQKSLRKAIELEAKSIAFPLIATGTYGFPRDKALKIALEEIQAFLLEEELLVILVVFDPDSFVLTGKVFDQIRSAISDKYVKDLANQEYINNTISRYDRLGSGEFAELYNRRYKNDSPNVLRFIHGLDVEESIKKVVMEETISEKKSFYSKVIRYIDESGEKAPDIYKRGEISRSIYSRMITDEDEYHPKKDIAIKWCLALKLNLIQSEDLLNSAGYSLHSDNLDDLIIRECIQRGVYDVVKIECLRFEYKNLM